MKLGVGVHENQNHHSRAKIERGLGTERARLGTFRGFDTERARLGTFRGFLEKVSNLKIWLKFATGNRQLGGRFSKNRPTCCNFEIFFPDPQLHQTFKPI